MQANGESTHQNLRSRAFLITVAIRQSNPRRCREVFRLGQRVLRMKDCPLEWHVGTPVQLFVQRWSEADHSWSESVAFTQGTVTPRRIVNGALFVLAGDEDFAESLPPGRYRISICVDDQNRIEADPALLLGDESWVGNVELRAQWREGFPKAEMISYADVARQPKSPARQNPPAP